MHEVAMSRLRWCPMLAGVLLLAACPPPEPPPCGEFDEVFVYVDADGDSFGSDEAIGWRCVVEPGMVANNADCDDTQEAVHPTAAEACDDIDNDCNGRVDEGNPFVPWYPDDDGDGYGVSVDAVSACAAPAPTYLRAGGDCDDQNPDVNPGAVEVCNEGVDDDCDGFADDDDAGVDPSTRDRVYFDGDDDGWGDDALFVDLCVVPPALPGTDRSGDCDDTRSAVHPGATEVCNGDRDDDCDGLADDDDDYVDPASTTIFFADADGDGYGDDSTFVFACEATPGIGVLNNQDCNDGNPDANIVQNWYADTDGDGAGDGPVVIRQCEDPGAGLVPEQNGIDCEPLDARIYPLRLEDCFDGVDQNCDAAIDCTDTDCFTEPTCVPPCADDVISPAGLPYSTSGTTVGMGDDLQPTTCSAAGGAPDLGFWFTPPVSGSVTIDMIGSSYDTTLYAVDACGGTEFACNDDYLGLGLQSQITITVTAGVPVLIVVDGFSSSSGTFNLNFN